MERITRNLSLGLAVFLCAGPLMAQTYPAKPIRVILGYQAGTGLDVTVRTLGTKMLPILGQPLVVENRPGAGGMIGFQAALTSEPDGYTVTFGPVGSLIPALVKNYVDSAQLAPISDTYATQLALFISSKLPVTSFKELIDYAKKQPPDSLNFGVSSAASDLSMAMVKSQMGITYTVINYPGGPGAINALLNGDIGMNMNTPGTYVSHLSSGKIRALFVTGTQRLAEMPDVPTADEVGIKNFRVSQYSGFWGPRGFPKPAAEKLYAANAAALKTPEVAALLKKFTYQPVGSSPDEQLKAYEESKKLWTEAARIANYVPQ